MTDKLESSENGIQPHRDAGCVSIPKYYEHQENIRTFLEAWRRAVYVDSPKLTNFSFVDSASLREAIRESPLIEIDSLPQKGLLLNPKDLISTVVLYDESVPLKDKQKSRADRKKEKYKSGSKKSVTPARITSKLMDFAASYCPQPERRVSKK